MANVSLNNGNRHLMIAKVATMAVRLREFEIFQLYDEKTPPYRDRKVAQDLYESCYPPVVSGLLDVINKELNEEGRALIAAYFNKSNHTSFTYTWDRLNVTSFDSAIMPMDRSIWMTFEEKVLSPDYGYMPVLSPENPKYEEFMNLYMMWSRDHTLSNYDSLVLSLTRFLHGRRTLGQARRDWPDVLRFVTPGMKRDLGDTVSKGKPMKDEYSLSEYEKEGLLNMLVEAAMVPDYIQTIEESKTSVFGFHTFDRGY